MLLAVGVIRRYLISLVNQNVDVAIQVEHSYIDISKPDSIIPKPISNIM